jgi:hypothetical protein
MYVQHLLIKCGWLGLTDRNWDDLAAAGWDVEWKSASPDALPFHPILDIDNYTGTATRSGLDLSGAIAEWQRITGERADAQGCRYCGQPHRFYLLDEAGHIHAEGPSCRAENDGLDFDLIERYVHAKRRHGRGPLREKRSV